MNVANPHLIGSKIKILNRKKAPKNIKVINDFVSVSDYGNYIRRSKFPLIELIIIGETFTSQINRGEHCFICRYVNSKGCCVISPLYIIEWNSKDEKEKNDLRKPHTEGGLAGIINELRINPEMLRVLFKKHMEAFLKDMDRMEGKV